MLKRKGIVQVDSRQCILLRHDETLLTARLSDLAEMHLHEYVLINQNACKKVEDHIWKSLLYRILFNYSKLKKDKKTVTDSPPSHLILLMRLRGQSKANMAHQTFPNSVSLI